MQESRSFRQFRASPFSVLMFDSVQNETKEREQTLKAEEIMHWSFSLFAFTELSDMMTKTTTMATAECCQSERGLSNMIFAFGPLRKVCGAKERN